MRKGNNSEIMPGIFSAENGIVLEGSTDRFYAWVGAKAIGQDELMKHISDQEAEVGSVLNEAVQRGINRTDVSNDYMWDTIVYSRRVGYGFGEDNKRLTKELFKRADVPLAPEFSTVALDGLKALSNLPRLQAVRYLVNPNTAEQMLQDYESSNTLA